MCFVLLFVFVGWVHKNMRIQGRILSKKGRMMWSSHRAKSSKAQKVSLLLSPSCATKSGPLPLITLLQVVTDKPPTKVPQASWATTSSPLASSLGGDGDGPRLPSELTQRVLNLASSTHILHYYGLVCFSPTSLVLKCWFWFSPITSSCKNSFYLSWILEIIECKASNDSRYGSTFLGVSPRNKPLGVRLRGLP